MSLFIVGFFSHSSFIIILTLPSKILVNSPVIVQHGVTGSVPVPMLHLMVRLAFDLSSELFGGAHTQSERVLYDCE